MQELADALRRWGYEKAEARACVEEAIVQLLAEARAARDAGELCGAVGILTDEDILLRALSVRTPA